MNVHDSEKIAGILRLAGYVRGTAESPCNLFILNTCSVREKAESKLYSYLGRLGRRKAAGEDITIGVMGCVAQQEGRELLDRAPCVDFVLGTHQVGALGEVLQRLHDTRSAVVETRIGSEFAEIHPSIADRQQPGRAYVTVMEGCDKFCSFCVIPFTRGRERYRSCAKILEEFEFLAERGCVVEVQLLGQNVNSWHDGETDFPDLLHRLDSFPVEWLRFITSHPAHFTGKLIERFGRSDKLCNQLHLPVQSGSDTVLTRMRRDYTRVEFLDRVSALRTARPDLSLSTDVIVGFPGETDHDFELTMSLVEQVRFDSMFSFAYSARPHSTASRWQDDIPHPAKIERLMRLQEHQKQIQSEINRTKVGRTLRVLVEGSSKKDGAVWSGHSSCNRVVNFVATSPALPGTLVDVRITAAGPNSLFGEKV